MEIEYPSARFVGRAKSAISRGEELRIRIRTRSRRRLLLKELPALFEEKTHQETWSFFARWFRLIGFITVHFYAMGARYKGHYLNEKELVVIYEPGRGN